MFIVLARCLIRTFLTEVVRDALVYIYILQLRDTLVYCKQRSTGQCSNVLALLKPGSLYFVKTSRQKFDFPDKEFILYSVWYLESSKSFWGFFKSGQK